MSEPDKSSTVVWKDPPPQRTRRYDWESIAKKLRRRPNQWALVFDDDKASIATALRAGAVRVLTPSKGFEVRTANNVREPERRCSMWLRYNPEKDTEK